MYKVSPDSTVKSLNHIVNNLDFHFSESKFESTLKIDNFSPIYFNKNAGGIVAGGSNKWITNKHTNQSIHEPATVGAFLFLQQNFSSRINTIFDVGALYGYFSLISKSMFPQSTVFSFEMNPSSYQALCQNVNSNKHLAIPAARCINMGLSDRTIFQQKVSIQNFILKELDENESEQSATINIISIDDYCRVSGCKPDLIKMDVEGYQAKILPGAIETIKANRPIILLEFDSQLRLSSFNTDNKSIVKPLFDLGYTCYWCKNQRSFKGAFQQLSYDTFSQEHEINSLAIFIP